jgi:hypothetical protein
MHLRKKLFSFSQIEYMKFMQLPNSPRVAPIARVPPEGKVGAADN